MRVDHSLLKTGAAASNLTAELKPCESLSTLMISPLYTIHLSTTGNLTDNSTFRPTGKAFRTLISAPQTLILLSVPVSAKASPDRVKPDALIGRIMLYLGHFLRFCNPLPLVRSA